ncbi:DUF397 domain-containing protein [Actinoallomurus purpureus]|nr:DUF397 domain-containing protein [Actinoallomurus purpureus]MCO6011039.1 DUF397 domain-containing protein [Actinoallomurus purpureus]
MTFPEWRKASRSSSNGGNCVEVAVAGNSEVDSWKAGQA